ncbi:M23 family metallopeptidase [Candidatus Haliotispira prima]|uniref:M23 family metallopeptidase n=1 Tax=Candidatus Haliotispira prima TaxID=3034016 RepID=A0ABY8MGT0_9SPIO|nr:M23 family metallopeptidase [Candidatus Haliotispira prima]
MSLCRIAFYVRHTLGISGLILCLSGIFLVFSANTGLSARKSPAENRRHGKALDRAEEAQTKTLRPTETDSKTSSQNHTKTTRESETKAPGTGPIHNQGQDQNQDQDTADLREPGIPKEWQAYPVISSLNRIKGVFRQFLIEVKENKRRWARRNSLLPLTLYVYQIQEQDNIFTISAKTSISVEGIATLNRIEHPNSLPRNRGYILIPNNSGIFLPQDQSLNGKEQKPYQSLSAWEQQLRQNREKLLFHRLIIDKRAYFYYPKSQFNQTERSYFLDNIFRSPVQQKFYVTSGFGARRDPITGKNSYHDGLDIRSPYGAPIYSIANGTVRDLGESRLYGLYVKIRLNNDKGQVVLYGHLTAALVQKGQRVDAGEVIGNSGQSGRITGPHLHLTVFEDNKAVDPAPLFRNLY